MLRLKEPEVIKRLSCSTQLHMKFVLLINLKLLTIANSFLPNIAEHKIYLLIDMNMLSIVGMLVFPYLLTEKISCSAELSMKKVY